MHMVNFGRKKNTIQIQLPERLPNRMQVNTGMRSCANHPKAQTSKQAASPFSNRKRKCTNIPLPEKPRNPEARNFLSLNTRVLNSKRSRVTHFPEMQKGRKRMLKKVEEAEMAYLRVGKNKMLKFIIR